ncbi:hypothetical protein niasHT_037556 [Heterodera trifolii]|uniref:Vacuolar protein sorting-associated protein 13C n=1 Tax=Heterodera trifolii TaxID=157864 RepID=A0ABD2INM5_9BILA
MKKHRQMVRDYREAWIHFRTHKMPKKAVMDTIERAEDALDVFNLNIARQQAELEIAKQSDLVRVEDQPQEGWVGWAKDWWFVGTPKGKEAAEDAQILEKLEKESTPMEKSRLYKSIDYQENVPPMDYPKHFVDNVFKVHLKTLKLKLDNVMELRFSRLSAKLEQRSAASAMRFTSVVKSLGMHAGTVSMLHMTRTDRAWLILKFETNPLKADFDQQLSLNIAPVMFKYHAPAVNKALDVFKPPKSVRLTQLTTQAIARYEDVKARSAAVLQYMVGERKKLKLKIKIDPAIFVVCSGGAFDPAKTTLIAELGRLRLKKLLVPSRKACQHITEQKLLSLAANAYDNFQLRLSNLRLIFSDSFANCMKARGDKSSDDHLLKPTGMCIDMLSAIIDDVQIPMFRLIGELPDLVLTISDDRLVELLDFFNTIPKPEFEEEQVDLTAPVRDRAKMKMISEQFSEEMLQNVLVDKASKNATEKKKADKKEIFSREQQVQLDLSLKLNEVGVVVKHRHNPFLSARIQKLGFRMCNRMFEMEVRAHMDSVAIHASPAAVSFLTEFNAKLAEQQQGKNQPNEENNRPTLREYPNYWEEKRIDRSVYWWFRPMKRASGTDAVNMTKLSDDLREAAELKRQFLEMAEFSIRHCLITVEAGVRDVTRPMILIESSVTGTARNWSSALSAKCETHLIVSYFNELFNVWEPVIEPVLHEDKGWQNWKLALKIGPQEEEVGAVQPSSSSPSASKKDKETSGHSKIALPSPKLAIIVEATETLDITITKSFLQQLIQLSEAFENASKHISTPRRELPGTSSHLLRNDTGLDISVSSTKSVKCCAGQYVPMDCVASSAESIREVNWRMKEDQRKIQLQLAFSDPDTERTVNIARTAKQCVHLPRRTDSGKKWSFVVETVKEDARHVITLKSLVTVLNHLEMPVEVQALHDSKRLPCGTALPKAAEPLNIPVPCLYTPNGLLKIRPVDGRYDWNNKSISWHDFGTKKRQAVRCDNLEKTGQGIYIEIVAVDEPIRRGNCRFVEIVSAYTVHLFPPIHFINTLPMPVQISVPVQCELAGGDGLDIMNLIVGFPLIFTVYVGAVVYELHYIVPSIKNPLETIRMKGKTNANLELCLGLNWSTELLRTNLMLYAPYWMVNETGKQLAYYSLPSVKCLCCFDCLSCKAQSKLIQIPHPPGANPVILPLKESEFMSEKKAKVKILGESNWSAEFPLDMAGSSGRITCKGIAKKKRAFEMTVDVQLGQSGLTKVVTISPFFLLQNDSKVDIEVREPHLTKWIVVPAESVIGFWPTEKKKHKKLVARYAKTKEESVQFPITEAFEGFCQIRNNLIGLYVIVSLLDESSVIHIENFVPGMVPAILMNDTKYPIRYRQMGHKQWQIVKPNQLAPFAWTDSLNDCKLEWESGDAENSDELLRNRDISYKPAKSGGFHYCVCFLDGRQRVLLFTADNKVSFNAQQAYEMEQPDIELELHLHGVGISLVNNVKSVEVLYMAISPGKQKKSDKESLKMATGFWCQYRQTAHQQTIHVKLHNFQMDNQLPASTFPSLLAMVPQPKSVVKNDPKPFLECSFVMNLSEHSNIVQIKLLEALVQEFAIRIDRTLLNELLDIIPKGTIQTGYTRESFKMDMELTEKALNKRALQTRETQAKAYYQRMHISPLLIHLSFSQGHVEKGKEGAAIQFMNLLLKSVGVTLTEIQDVIFKYLLFDATFYSRAQLQSEVISHYTRQFIKQLYVLVLGLDILGNPFGLFRNLRTGAVDLFYQPVLGIFTAAEFGEGVYIGLTSAFSHTVGGVLGLASRITGTMGKGVAALTLDEDYQRRRMQARHQPTSIGVGMFRGVRGLGTSVVEGVTGIVSKPVEGVKQGGLLGGIKGIGKGMVGAIARPVSGVVDLVTTTADNVRNAIINVEDVKPIRPPRVISHDKIIRPYVFEEAVGYKIFRETDRGQFAETDHYLTYGGITKRLVIIVTDKHIIEAWHHKLTGNWNATWKPKYAELKRPTRVGSNGKFGIKLRLKKEKKGFSFFSSKDANVKGKIVQFGAERVAQRVFEHILRAWKYGVAD